MNRIWLGFRLLTAAVFRCSLASALWSAAWAEDSGPPTVTVEEDVYRYTSANNGAGPLWCAGSTTVVAADSRVWATALETVEEAAPLNNCRWVLLERTPRGWVRRHVDEGRTREPSPLAVFSNAEIWVSANPTLGQEPEPNGGPARPELWQFSQNGNPRRILPQWQEQPRFSEHSYRSLAADGSAGELMIWQNIGYTHAEWAFRDAQGAWPAQGKLEWPTLSGEEGDKPLRLCYPNVALIDRQAHFFGVGDVVEPVAAWRKFKQDLSGQQWDYVFRRLYHTFSSDISSEPFQPWQEIANVEATAGHLWPCDLWVAPDKRVHLLWSETALDERLRDRFFPEAKQARRLLYAALTPGQPVRPVALLESREDDPGLFASRARFHVHPGGSVAVVAHVSGTGPDGESVSENRLRWLLASDREAPSLPWVTLPLKHPFTQFFTATPRAGSDPDRVLRLFGAQEGKELTLSYAEILLDAP